MGLTKLLPLLILLIISGCASKTQKPKSKVKKFSKTMTIKEKLRAEAIARYRKMRLESLRKKWGDELPIRLRKKKLKFKPSKTKISTYGKPHKKVRKPIPPRVIPTPKPRRKILANPDELKIEIDQNLAYYCMLKRKKFSNESDCKQVTKNALEICEGSFDSDDRGLLRCVKSRLKF